MTIHHHFSYRRIQTGNHTLRAVAAIACLIVFQAAATQAISATSDTTVVQRFGALKTAGNKIVDQNGNPVVLRGMSLYWSQWKGQFYNTNCVQWLRNDWKCSVVRASMAVEMGGYLTNALNEKTKIKNVINACIAAGIYVIVDWHDHHAQWHTPQAIAFFEEIARLYHDKPNIIYEIYNEPLQVSWADSVKPYADTLARRIRAIDPNNLIIVGSPTWSQDVDIAAGNPLTYSNIAYTLHFYAATHKQSLRNKAAVALAKGAALFVSEFGTTEASGTGKIDSAETELWMKFMNDNQLSWCNWSVADLSETSAALKPGASGDGGWPLSEISISGLWIRNKIRTENAAIVSGIRSVGEAPLNFQLDQNYPNPFNPSTTIGFQVPEDGLVTIDIFDALGRKVDTLLNEFMHRGIHHIRWTPSHVSSGVFFCQLKAGSFVDMRRMIVLK
ncbi:MAG TPA: cellulase family glycosylhydrolase [Bacteroidota bacterium]|nr:cellulase family glycosylhydrolase [Bacteroidota bacterium]